MDNRGLTSLNVREINHSFVDLKLHHISSRILYEVAHELSEQEIAFLNLPYIIRDGENICYINPFIPLMIFYFKNSTEEELLGVHIKHGKTISDISFSKLHFNEPSDTKEACRIILEQKKFFSPGIILEKEFFLKESMYGIFSYASNFNPNFFKDLFPPLYGKGNNDTRFLLYQKWQNFESCHESLIFYPWGFRYKNFSSWNHNLKKLSLFLIGKKITPSLNTLHSIFPKIMIKETLHERR